MITFIPPGRLIMGDKKNSYKLQQLRDSKESFDSFWQLMVSCFHSEYLRTYDGQKSLLNIHNYNTLIFKDGENVIALITWWSFSKCNFIEYIGVSTLYRHQCLAGTLLSRVLQGKKLTILEVEESNTIARSLYLDKGFSDNSYDYIPMALRHEIYCGPKLLLMSFPRRLSEGDYRWFIKEIHKPKYNQYKEENK